MPEITDIEIVKASLDGDVSAFEILVQRYISGIYKFSYYYVRDAAEAEDITQETFIRAWKNLKKFDQEKSFKTWLWTIAKNSSLDFIKKKKPLFFSRIAENDDELSSLLAPYSEREETISHLIDRKILKGGLDKILGTLPASYQAVLSLRYNENLKFVEIAEKLGEPIDTVKSRHRRGLIMLREAMA